MYYSSGRTLRFHVTQALIHSGVAAHPTHSYLPLLTCKH